MDRRRFPNLFASAKYMHVLFSGIEESNRIIILRDEQADFGTIVMLHSDCLDITNLLIHQQVLNNTSVRNPYLAQNG